MEITVRTGICLLTFLFGGFARSQYMYCPPQDWELGSTVTLRCYPPKVDYPSKCVTDFTDTVEFNRRPLSGNPETSCTLSGVSNNTCTASPNQCSCETGNTTHYILQHTFTVQTDDDGTWQCNVRCNNGLAPQLQYSSDNCDNRDVVAHAELSTPTLTVTTPATGSGWTVRGNVDITRIFSSAGQYSCVWEEKRPGSGSYTQIVNKAPTIDPPASGTSVRTGRCDFPDRTLSATAGTYTYRVTVSPGQTVKTDSSVVVETPATPSISCSPTGYVSEGGELTCTCSGDVGRPAGRLQLFRESTNTFTHGQYGGNTLQEKLTVSKADNGKKVRCDVDWITDITGADFTIQVAYGPTRADLSNPPVYELHPTQSNNQPLTLTCSAVGVSPDATYSWSGSRCGGTTGNTCSFVPTQGDNGGDISCTAVNTITNVRKTSDTRTLRIHYPPSSPPVITGYSGGVLYAGNTQSMTCTVQGGNPAVSSVTFTCDSGGQVSGVSSTIQVTASRDNNGRQCTCSANWKNKNPPWYTQTASVTLQVYYAPVTPTIEYRQQKYPFLAGESPTLYCTLPSGADSGNPPAALTFESQTGSAGQREVSVTLPELTSADNGRRVECQANNAFTTHNNTPVKQDWTLVVYYISQTITALPANTCMMTSPDSNTCQVKEGQRVHVSCSADSNPSPPTVTWQQGSGSSLDFTADRSRPLTYVCDARSSSSGSGDRLPLRRNITLTVLTTYAAEVSQFTVNNANNVTVSEGDPVTLTCKAVGRPTAAMSIVKEGSTLNSAPQGQVSVEKEATLTYRKDGATCDATGQYRCDVDNGEGQANAAHLMVFVNCPPRQQEGSPEIPTYLNYKGGSVGTEFPLTMYPAVKSATLHYLGPLSNSTTSSLARENLYKLQCTATDPSRLYWTTCNLTISNVTQKDKGFYSVTVGNGVGQPINFQFELEVNGTKQEDPSAFPIAAAVGGGLGAAALIIGVVVVVIVVQRKRAEKNENHYRQQPGQRQDRNSEAEPDMIVNSLYGTSPPVDNGDDDDEDETMIINTLYQSSADVVPTARPQPQTSAYEIVEHSGGVPVVMPTPAAGPGGVVYSDVARNWNQGPAPAAATGEDGNAYALVDRTRQQSAAGASGRAAAKPEVKPKPRQRPQAAENAGGRVPQPPNTTDDPSNVYGNMPGPSVAPRQGEGDVYENHQFEDGEKGAVARGPPAGPKIDGGTEGFFYKSEDGLLYAAVGFQRDQQHNERPPPREKTEYMEVRFPPKS
ncbi:uncharacterized protein LOC143277422 [Babylonia areolata]|uniref:uncharacterized protein LOC143277422 n=1 Tax=Babylonia areolata TaxID=304850 RepID=UPI003FD0D45B